LKPQIRNFWRSFEQSAGADAGARFYEAFHFDDNEPSANELAALVLAGVKRATAGLLWALEADRKVLPKRGDLSVMTDWGGTPLCVIETQLVGCDEKRMHLFHRMLHGKTKELIATNEIMQLHVDQRAGKVTPMRGDLYEALSAVWTAHKKLAKPAELGRVMKVKPKSRLK